MPSIAYLPGAGGQRSFWRPVAERLADLGPAICLGWPGFGDEPADPTIGSLADLVPWTLARLPEEPVHLVAQSMGGVVATLVALEHPERVGKLVLCATSGGVDAGALGAADWRPDYRAEFPHAPNWFLVDRTDLSARLHTIAVPTLILYGDQDPLCTERIAGHLAGRIPGATLACIAGGNHLMARERPDQVAPRIRAHLAGSTDLRTAAGRPDIALVGPSAGSELLNLIEQYYRFDGIAYHAHMVARGLEALLSDTALGLAWLVRMQGTPVGYAIATFGFDLEFGGRQATLTEIFISEGFRGLGLGRALLGQVERECRARGALALELQVESDNVEARAFYKAAGYRVHERIPLSKRL